MLYDLNAVDDGSLTTGEAIRRLKENPYDPELLKYLKSLQEIFDIDLTKTPDQIIYVLDHLLEFIFRDAIGTASIENFIVDLAKISPLERSLLKVFATPYTPFLNLFIPKLQNNISIPEKKFKKIKIGEHKSIEIQFKSEVKFLYEELIRVKNELSKIKGQERNFFYDSQTATFIVLTTRFGALNLASDKNGGVLLFEIFYEYLLKRGFKDDLYTVVFIPRTEIISKLIIKGKTDANVKWITNTRSNIVKSVKKHNLSDLIVISEYDKFRQGYWFKVMLQIDIPNLSLN